MSLVKDLRLFLGKIRTNPTGLHLFRHLPHFGKWQALKGGGSPLNDEVAWITFGSLARLKSILRPEYHVFEFGSGGSSAFFSKHVKMVTTVEHNEQWIEFVEAKMRSLGRTNWKGILVPPTLTTLKSDDYSDPDLFLSGDLSYQGMSFEKYASAIDAFPNNHFDVVMVDGRARPSCIKKSLPKVKSGGFLVVDNSERDYYFKKLDLEAMGFKMFFNDFGPGPYGINFWQTTIWRKG